MSQREPAPDDMPSAVLGWDVPALAYYWPLDLGGGAIGLAVAAAVTPGGMPWFGYIAVLTGIAGIFIGLGGHAQLNDARDQLSQLTQ